MDNTKKDIFGNDTKVGQKVIFVHPYYHNFVVGEVIKLTPKGVRVKYLNRVLTHDCDTMAFEWVNDGLNVEKIKAKALEDVEV